MHLRFTLLASLSDRPPQHHLFVLWWRPHEADLAGLAAVLIRLASPTRQKCSPRLLGLLSIVWRDACMVLCLYRGLHGWVWSWKGEGHRRITRLLQWKGQHLLMICISTTHVFSSWGMSRALNIAGGSVEHGTGCQRQCVLFVETCLHEC